MNNASKCVPFYLRMGLLCVAWVAAWISISPDLETLRAAQLFPLGLFVALHFDLPDNVVFTVGWLLYIGLSTAVTFIRRRWSFILVYSLLIIFLALNVYGCHHMNFGGV